VARRITATAAARGFSDIVNQVHYQGEEFLVERGGTTVCRIVPAGPRKCTLAELASVLESAPRADRGFATAVTRAARAQPKVGRSPWGR
jgi:antitoxin (DNA-binding transcriptional repressor) of toxin-antitoxin stability system